MTVSGADGPASTLGIRLFGSLDVRLHGAPFPRLRSRKGLWLLALLALRHGREVDRDWLVGTFWPDSPETQALSNLRRSLTDLRRALGPEAGRLRSSTPHTLALDLAGAAVDVVAFDAAIGRGDPASLERAVALYRGPLLEGCGEEWAFQERQAREQAYLGALETLATQALTCGEPGVAEQHLRQAVAVDPLRESAQRALLHALAAGGNYAAALLAYRELRLRLHRDLHAEPDPETTALFQQIRVEARGKAGRASAHPTCSVATPIPEDTVTFLFTEVEGSTCLWEEHPEAMRAALLRHDALLHHALQAHGGHVFKTFGDQFCAAFATAPDALEAALAAQRALQAEPWEEVGSLRVRMALHTGAAEAREEEYFGLPLNRVARLLTTAHGGQVLLSLAAAELVRDHLPEGVSLRDMGERRLQDLVRPERIFQLVTPDLPAEFPPLRSLEVFPNNLPLQLTSFIGREREMAEVNRLLATHRLVTLTGAGGCGKTRLALQVAGDRLAEFAHGAWFVDLAPLADPALVPQAVAGALGVLEAPGRPLVETLVAVLKSRQLLLVLDNCEHLVTASAALAEALLQTCPQLWVLATSREPLGITGETPYRVPPLSVPDLQQPPTLESLTQYEAVRLFIERAVTALPTFAVTNENAPAVAQVCHRLDGIPLAIELAATRVRALPVEQIAIRLDDRFRLLTGGSRTALPRQQTLRALIDWSYDLLTEPERVLLRRVSVFAGGWTLEAAEAVCAGRVPTEGGSRIEAWEVIDPLTSLVEKSLVVYDEWGGTARYRLLETVRQYSRDRLLESREGETVRGRHRDFFLQLAEEAETAGWVGEANEWLDHLEADHDNLLAALEWCQRGEAESALRLSGALGWFWHSRGYWNEGREWLEQTLSRAEPPEPTLGRAKVLFWAGRLAMLVGDSSSTRIRFEESAALFRALGDARGLIHTLACLAGVFPGNSAEARALREESIALSRSLGDQRLLASVLNDSEERLALARQVGDEGTIAWALLGRGCNAEQQGDWKTARDLLEQSLALLRKGKNKAGIAWALFNLGNLLYQQGEDQTARSMLYECLSLARELGLAHEDLIGWTLASLTAHASSYEECEELLQLASETDKWAQPIHLLGAAGHMARERGDYQRAATFYQRSLALRHELRDSFAIAQSLEDFAGLAARQQQWARATRLLGAAEEVCSGIDAAPPVAGPEEYERAIRGARAALGEEAFAAAWAEGRALTLEQAIQYAQEEAAGD